MNLDHKAAALVAQDYFDAPHPLKRLGWGIGGSVYLSPDTLTAVKVHHGYEGFVTELKVYEELASERITQLHGLTIPRLVDFRRDVWLIQMDFVSPPFLLDFAGVRFTSPEVEFDADRLEHWHATILDFFGPNASIAYAVHHSLAQYGLYYLDFRPSNMNLKGHPDLEEPFDASEEDD